MASIAMAIPRLWDLVCCTTLADALVRFRFFRMQVRWQYNWAGTPAKTQDVVNRIRTQSFTVQADGVPGNNDWGAMNAWYVLLSLGLYPEIPGVGGLAISGPQFAKTVITLEDNHTITLSGTNVYTVNKYIQSATLNGIPYTSPWILFSALANTATNNTLSFGFGSSPSAWGAAPTTNIPPSFGPIPVKVDDSNSGMRFYGTWTAPSADAKPDRVPGHKGYVR